MREDATANTLPPAAPHLQRLCRLHLVSNLSLFASAAAAHVASLLRRSVPISLLALPTRPPKRFMLNTHVLFTGELVIWMLAYLMRPFWLDVKALFIWF